MKHARSIFATTLVASALFVSSAAAHVEFTPSEVSTADATLVTFTVPHDCNGNGTTQIEMKVPDEVTTFTPVALAGWTITTTTSDAAPPMDMSKEDTDHEDAASEHDAAMHAGSTGKHVDTVTWVHDGGPLPTGTAAAFQALVAVDHMATDTIALPTVQTCPEGEKMSWIDVPAAGQDDEELESPAPTLTPVAGEDHHDATTSESGSAKIVSVKVVKDAQDTADQAQMLAIVGIVLGALALLGAVLLRRRRK